MSFPIAGSLFSAALRMVNASAWRSFMSDAVSTGNRQMLRLRKWTWRLITYFLFLTSSLWHCLHAVIVHIFFTLSKFQLVIPLSSIKPGSMRQGGGCVSLTGLGGFDLQPLLLHLGNVILTCPSLSLSLAISHGHSKETHVLCSPGKCEKISVNGWSYLNSFTEPDPKNIANS